MLETGHFSTALELRELKYISDKVCVLSSLVLAIYHPVEYCAVSCVKSLQSCLTLCNPLDRSPPGSSVHGVSQARILEWVVISFSRGSSQPRDQTAYLTSSAFAGGFFTTSATWETL